jgi:TolB-like protein
LVEEREQDGETQVEERAIVLGDRYKLLSLLGSGGMGSVYRVFDLELDEIVALKVLRRDLVTDERALGRFRSEVKLARRVTHVNVARTFDIGEHADEKFLTMEFVEGASLAAMLAEEGPLPNERVIEMTLQVCAGLAAAHAVDVVHRDLKPANVMRTPSGRTVITDFGIACARAESDAIPAIVGTPAFMAPEQLLGERSLDGRTDIFALGAMIYVLLTNERPFGGSTLAEALRIRLADAAPDPRRLRPNVPEPLAGVVMRCLAADRNDRFATVADVAAALGKIAVQDATAQGLRARIVDPGLAPRPGLRTVAVVPFRNAGASADAYVAQGFTADLVDALGATPALRVRSTGAVAEAHDPEASLREIGHRLGVDAIVEGSLFRVADSVRVSARLLAVENDLQLWGARMTRPFSELLAVGDEVAGAVAAALTAARDAPLRASTDPVAIDLYLRARATYHDDWRGEKLSPGLFERALERAPDDPTLQACYAMALSRGMGPLSAGDRLAEHTRARIAAERAVSAAPHLAEAHLALSRVRYDDAEIAAAARSLRQALHISPSNAEAHWLWGWMHAELGDVRFGIERLTVAGRLDPRMSVTVIERLRAHALLGEWDRVDELYAAPSSESTLYPRLIHRARLLMWRGDVAAVQQLADAGIPTSLPVLRDVVESILRGRMTPALVELFGRAMEAAKDVPRSHCFAIQLACEYRAFGGEREEALALLETADASHLFDINWLDRCPVLRALHVEPRFQAVRARTAARAAVGLAVLRELEG